MEQILNASQKDLWEEDIERSVSLYNAWYLNQAPVTYQKTWQEAQSMVDAVFDLTDNLRVIEPELLKEHPLMLVVLRMCTIPLLSKDRLVGLTGVSKGFIMGIESAPDLYTPLNTRNKNAQCDLASITETIQAHLCRYFLPWLPEERSPQKEELDLAKGIITDRLSHTWSEFALRNAQEKRQLDVLENLLLQNGYQKDPSVTDYLQLEPGMYAFHLNIPIGPLPQGKKRFKSVPVDLAIQPFFQEKGTIPVLIEAKSAGDFTNTNKRRKEETAKFHQLKKEFGDNIQYYLFIGGYFNAAYLESIASQGMDWIWEHRSEDLLKLLQKTPFIYGMNWKFSAASSTLLF